MKIKSTIPKRRVAAAEAKVSRLYARYSEGIAVSVLRLGGIMAAGRTVALAGGTDEEVGKAIAAAVQAAAQ